MIATKVRFPMGEGPNEVGLSRKHILDAVEASLRRLRTDYIDLYQVHAWDSATPLEETLSTLDRLVRDGKVRYLGVEQFRRLAAAESHRSEQNARMGTVCLPAAVV